MPRPNNSGIGNVWLQAFLVRHTQPQQRTCEQKMAANKRTSNNLTQIHDVQLPSFPLPRGWPLPSGVAVTLSGGAWTWFNIVLPNSHSLIHMPADHLHGNARAGLDLEKWGSWSFCHNGGEESRGTSEALFIQRGGWRTTPKAHRTPCLCDGELSGSCWGDSVWCQRGWLLPTCGGGHPSCSRRLQLCLFHSGS